MVVFLDNNFFFKKSGKSTSVDSTSVAARGEYFAVVLCFTFLNFKNKNLESIMKLC